MNDRYFQLFNSRWYLERYPDVALGFIDPLHHYVEQGAAEGRWPCPLFDTRWYLEQHVDVAASGMNPLLHFIDYGAREGRWPCALFDTRWYRERYLSVSSNEINPLAHYLDEGLAQGNWPCALFDTGYYLDRNSDVAASGINPLMHYLERGAAEGRWPCALFDTRWYLERNGDVVATQVNPLAHYLEHGATEGRWPCSLFDTRYYLIRYSDVAESGMNPLYHYLEYGVPEGRWPCAKFDTLWYMKRYTDVAAKKVNPLAHYLEYGAREKRWTCSKFDTRWYLDRYPDVAESGVNPLAHYLEHGAKEGRWPTRQPPINFQKVGPGIEALAEAKAMVQRYKQSEPSIKEFQYAEMAEFDMLYQEEGNASRCWRKLFRSVLRKPSHIAFASDFSSTCIAEALHLIVKFAKLGRSDQELLIVETDTEIPSTNIQLDCKVNLVSLAEFNVILSQEDRTELVTSLIHQLQPKSALTIDSSAAWAAIIEHGTALSERTRIFGWMVESSIDQETRLPLKDHALMSNFRACISKATSLIVPHRSTKIEVVSLYDLPRRFASKIKVVDETLDDNALLQLLYCEGGFLAKKAL